MSRCFSLLVTLAVFGGLLAAPIEANAQAEIIWEAPQDEPRIYGFSSSGTYYGNHFRPTETVTLTRADLWASTPTTGLISGVAVYSRPSAANFGNWTLEDSSAVPFTAGTATQYWNSDPLEVVMTVGNDYIVAFHLTGAMSYSLITSPMDPPWGLYSQNFYHDGAWLQNNLPHDAVGFGLSMRLVTCAVGDCTIDNDGDGELAATDCDDNDPNNFNGNVELCDGADNDCNGLADFDAAGEVDADGDGDLSCSDCDDNDANNFNGNVELCDGADNDCNGLADFDAAGEVDADGDGGLSCSDCDDNDANNFYGNAESCDGLDNDCFDGADFDAAGEVDADGDGDLSCSDCDDTDDAVNLDAPEDNEQLCSDVLDNDCDGDTDADDSDCDGLLGDDDDSAGDDDRADRGCGCSIDRTSGGAGYGLLLFGLLGLLRRRRS